ncbi:F0F1 ATP synthase subunit delta [Candidatus Gottesmanbacteria bacterium]|nr:F0F1 ATP synthase subunit delta [Candidatus Gottesmanbacteria bacterium]
MAEISPKPKIIVQVLKDYLKDKREENLLPEVINLLENQINKSRKADRIVVQSIVPLGNTHLTKIKKVVNSALGLDLPVTNQIEKSLLGGLTVRVGDWFLDASLRRDLDNLKIVLLT